jgi:hypothetical protein
MLLYSSISPHLGQEAASQRGGDQERLWQNIFLVLSAGNGFDLQDEAAMFEVSCSILGVKASLHWAYACPGTPFQ